ncbi:MAG: DUF504 domain-containing protein [Nanoarchaeota archaeon]|nr:DUF504 domain-containing protein [Nanoarchaeota archaeon]
MITAFEFLNKIKWDKRENPSLYTIHIYDRILKKNIEIKYTNIKEIGKSFMTIKRNDEETEIPLHRIREIRKSSKIVWKR